MLRHFFIKPIVHTQCHERQYVFSISILLPYSAYSDSVSFIYDKVLSIRLRAVSSSQEVRSKISLFSSKVAFEEFALTSAQMLF